MKPAYQVSILGLVTIALAVSPQPASAELLLHYAMDGPEYADRGSPPAAPGTAVSNDYATSTSDTPGGFSCYALDVDYFYGSSYLTTETDVDKIDALPAMTVTFWLNLRSSPQAYDYIMSDMPGLASSPPAGTGGWGIHIEGVDGDPRATNFSLAFEVSKSIGGYISAEYSVSSAINAYNKWVFVAITFDSYKFLRYYLGDETNVATQIGDTFLYSYDLLDNSSEFRVASDTSHPDADHTPPAYIDDVRIYNVALTQSQIDAIRQENLDYVDMDAVPGFLPLKGIPGSGCGTWAYGASADGSFIVGSNYVDHEYSGFRWHDGEWIDVGDLPGGDADSVAYDVSDDGSVVVGYSSSDLGNEAFRWENNTMVGLGNLTSGQYDSYAYATSADGSVVVGYSYYGSTWQESEAFRWENDIMTGLGYQITGSAATGVTSDGAVVVGATDNATGTEVCYWDSNGLTLIGELPGGVAMGAAWAISADGSTIVGYSNSDRGYEAFRWKDNQMYPLGDFPGGFYETDARGVSADGSIIVGNYSAIGIGHRAFIWTAQHGLRDLQQVLTDDYGLDLDGWVLTHAEAISDDGQTIVGRVSNPDGFGEAYRIRLPDMNKTVSHSADLNDDGYVDDDDMDLFRLCVTGPEVPYDFASLPSGCEAEVGLTGIISVDFDEDGDVDQTDFGMRMQSCYSRLQPASSECLE